MRTTTMSRTLNLAVGTVQKSIETMSLKWFRRKVIHPWDRDRVRRIMYHLDSRFRYLDPLFPKLPLKCAASPIADSRPRSSRSIPGSPSAPGAGQAWVHSSTLPNAFGTSFFSKRSRSQAERKQAPLASGARSVTTMTKRADRRLGSAVDGLFAQGRKSVAVGR